jgi:hypothetical protein
MALPEEKMIAPSKALLAEIEAFLDAHYDYRCLPKYKGFFGRIKAHFDKLEDDRKRAKREHYEWVEKNSSSKCTVLYSDPEGAKSFSPRFETKKREDTFSIELFKLIEAKGKDPVEVYKRAYIDRKLFSKIRSNEDYQPSKNTAIALALALALSLEETQTLLKRAGFTLSRSIMFDVIIEYFITHENYDIVEINKVLFSYDLPILG